MREILDWLKGVEKRAWTLYESASSAFSSDYDLSCLLKSLAEDEKQHYNIISKQILLYSDTDITMPLISMDKDIVDGVARSFEGMEKRLSENVPTVTELLDAVITLEFSELNGIFLYAVESLKKTAGKDFPDVSGNMEEHKNKIVRFIFSRPELSVLAQRAKEIPHVLSDRILVVDNNRLNINLLRSILENYGFVDAAGSGSEAMEKLNAGYFSVVITTMDMPVMNGLEFYNMVVERYPRLKNCFLFIINSRDDVMTRFLIKHHLRFLIKPAPVSNIRKNVRDVLHHSSPSSSNG